jgi:hypothetical protein
VDVRAYSAEEDTAIFLSWEATMSTAQREELAQRFEELGRRQLGGDGFEDAVRQIADIEAGMGLSLIGFTPPGARHHLT